MHIDTFRSEFINQYMTLREELMPGGRVNAYSKPNMVRAALDKALLTVFSTSDYPFLELPLLGASKDGFYQAMKTMTLSEIETYALEAESQKSDFMAGFRSMMLAETHQLKAYAAVALALKDINDPRAGEYATSVLDNILKWSGPLLGALFVNLRQFNQWVVTPIKEIINSTEAENFMIQEKTIITMEDSLEEAQEKLDKLYKIVKKKEDEGIDVGLLPNFSINDSLQSFTGGEVSMMEAEA